MGDLSRHFSRREFDCKCGRWHCPARLVKISPELIEKLEVIRIYTGGGIRINSGIRCRWYNRKIGGASRSRHLSGVAADIVSYRMTPTDIQSLISRLWPHSYGLGRYRNFTHFDVRNYKARWGDG